jgi:opacity protein-like surface antigen
MKKIVVAAAVALGLIASASAATAKVIINFDDLTGYDAVPEFYAGVNWQGNFVHYDDEQSPYNPSSGNTRIFGVYEKFPCCDISGMAFKVGAGSIFNGGFFAGYNRYVYFQVRNAGALVAISNFLALSDTPTFLSSDYSGPMDEVTIYAYQGSWVVDDLTFEKLNPLSSAAPEPSTWALLIAGFGGAGAMLRRRRTGVVTT